MRLVLVGLAERSADVVIGLGHGRSHLGRVSFVGADVVVVTTDADLSVAVRLGAVASVRTQDPAQRGRYTAGVEVSTEDASRRELTMREILSHWLVDRPRINAWSGDASCAGVLAAVGSDVVTLELERSGGVVYLRLDSLTEVSLSASSPT